MHPAEPPAERSGQVTRDYAAQHADPIAVAAGEPFTVTDRHDAWEDNPAWIWVSCSDARGKRGWVPQSIIQLAPDGVTGTTAEPYDARELTVRTGETLTIEQEAAGWYWCREAQGRRGWVPVSHVRV
ncbi:MAG TPA: SH3 domain-containing protein [Chloroflexia bacterium]|nr:SH3 domain-containing protein [Chloroflexia bacterium]